MAMLEVRDLEVYYGMIQALKESPLMWSRERSWP